MLHAPFTRLVKVDAEEVAKLALEVQLLKRRVRLITGRVLDDGLAEALLLAHLTEAHLQPAAHNCAELAADLLKLVLRHL